MWPLSYTWFKPRCWPCVPRITGPWGLWDMTGNGSAPWQRQCRWNYATNCCPVAGRASFAVQKSLSCPFSVNGHPGDRGKCSWRPWAGQGPSELRKREGRKQNWVSVLAALRKWRKRGRGCSQQLEGRLIFPLKLGNHFLAAAVTARVSNRGG